jgi:hypothetical protein
MNNNYYKSPKSNWLMRQFWKAAGADAYILERCTYNDQIKQLCVGGLILSIGFFAFLGGAYAFYLIIHMEVDANQTELSFLYTSISIVFGIIWGWLIFNFNRFLYVSSGKGDGTEAITFRELIYNIPKMLFSIVFSVFVSLPISVSLLDFNYKGSTNGLGPSIISKVDRFAEKVRFIFESNPFFLGSIILFFALISLTPILIKLMLVKGPFEQMEENIVQLSNAEMGIEVIYEFYEDTKGNRRDKVINHPVEFKIRERKKLIEAQQRINDKIIKEYLLTKQSNKDTK